MKLIKAAAPIALLLTAACLLAYAAYSVGGWPASAAVFGVVLWYDLNIGARGTR